MDNGNDHGLKLLAARIGEKGTQAEFCREAGCSEPHLSLVLRGKRGLSLKLAKTLSELTGIPLADLPITADVAEALREPAA